MKRKRKEVSDMELLLLFVKGFSIGFGVTFGFFLAVAIWQILDRKFDIFR